ncbi:hypothetical protein [Streptomyces umbrinus]|uniref:hypothetical protein n=1 Tax=Streptomyces umbrinus TaxID=67370 RepID=UPI003418A1C7
MASLGTCAVLWRQHGARVLPGAAMLLAACWSSVDSHIFWPRGVFTMLGFALAFAVLSVPAFRSAVATARTGTLTNH